MGDCRSQIILPKRKKRAVLEDVAAILDIIPSFLVDRTARLVWLDSRFDTNISRCRYGRAFERLAIHSMVFKYYQAVYI